MMRADHDWMLWRRRHAGPIDFSQCKNGNVDRKKLAAVFASTATAARRFDNSAPWLATISPGFDF